MCAWVDGNPVQRKLVAHPKDWPGSSWSHYLLAEHGLIRIDSLGNGSSGTTTAAKKRQKPSYSCALIFGRVNTVCRAKLLRRSGNAGSTISTCGVARSSK